MEVNGDAFLASMDTNGDGIVDDNELLGAAASTFDPDGDGVGNHDPPVTPPPQKEEPKKKKKSSIKKVKTEGSVKKGKNEDSVGKGKKEGSVKRGKKEGKPAKKEAETETAHKYYKTAFAKKMWWTKSAWFDQKFSTADCDRFLCGKASPAGAFVVRQPPEKGRGEELSKADVCLSINPGHGEHRAVHVLIKNRHDTSDKKNWFLWDDDHWFEDMQDLVKFAETHPFNFPKLEFPSVKLNVKAAAKVIAAAKKVVIKEVKKKKEKVIKEKKANYKKMTPEQKQIADMNDQVERMNAPIATAPAAVKREPVDYNGDPHAAAAKVTTAEERKAMKKAEQNQFEADAINPDADPDRDIGEIGSSFVKEDAGNPFAGMLKKGKK